MPGDYRSSDPLARGNSSGSKSYRSSDPLAGKRATSSGSSSHGHGLAHWLGSKVGLAAHDIKAIPGGLVETAHFAASPFVSSYDRATGNAAGAGAEIGFAHQFEHGVAAQTKQTVAHPLRDPFQTAVLLAPIGHGVGSVAERGAAVADAARAGEGVRGVVKAAAKPEIKPRLLKMGDTKVPLHQSANPAMRAAQRGYDALLQRSLDRNPEGRVAAHAAKRIGGSLAETSRFQQRMRQAVADDLERAGRKLGSRKVAQAALRLTSENSTPEEAAAFHRAQAAKGAGVRENKLMAALYDRVAAKGILTQNEHGDVVVDAARYPEVAEVDAKLARGQTRVDQILREYDLMTEEGMQSRRDLPGQLRRGAIEEPTTTVSGPLSGRSTPSIQKRLQTLDAHYEKVLGNVTASEKVQNLRGLSAAQNRLGAKYRAQNVAPTDQLRAYAESKLQQVLDSRPNDPTVRKMQAELDEAAALRKELAARNDAAIGLGEHTAEDAPLNRARSMYGPEGRGYVPYRLSDPKAPKNAMAASSGPVVGAPRSFVEAKAFTGAGLEKGLVPDDTTGLFARHLRRALRFVSTDQFRRMALQTGSQTRRSSRDVLVRIPDEKAAKLTLEVEQALGRKHVNLDEIDAHAQAMSAFLDRLVPGRADNFVTDRAQSIGTPAPKGYRWVDEKVLGDQARFRPQPRGKIAKGIDTVNSAVTAATVYFKIGHVGTRALTNAATMIVQGSAAPLQLAKSVRLWRDLSREDRVRALAAAGQHGYEAMPHEGENLVGRAATHGAQWWAKHVDAPFRFGSIAYEARRAGFRTTGQFRQLLAKLEDTSKLEPAERARVERVAKEANRAGIAYDRLNGFERSYIARGVWFFPFVKGASVFAGRTFLEHPYKSAVLGEAGVQGRIQQQNELGDLPSYEQGLLKLGRGSNPLVADFSTFSPFATLADVMQAAATPRDLAGFANPVVGSVDQLAHGANQYGGTSKTPYLDALLALAASTPEQQIATAYVNRKQDQSKRMFRTTPGSALARLLAGPGLPRRINLDAAHAAAIRERTGR